MKAGRELDVKIGDEFFDMEFWYGDPTGFRIEENTDYWIVGSENSYGELGKRCPFFTTQIADAWLVVEEMGKLQMQGHVGPSMLHRLRECATKGWGVIWCSDFGYTQEVFADTAPLAICLAAMESK